MNCSTIIPEGINNIMKNDKTTPKIKVSENGPFIITGNVSLSEKIITPKGKCYEFKTGGNFPRAEEYNLCRCGESGNKPFCDGSHAKTRFDGTETASKTKYKDRAELFEGPGLDLLDDNRCAFSRFCHREIGKVWDLIEISDNEDCRKEAIKGAGECPSGRLVAVEKTGKAIEPEYDPSIDIIQDPEKGVSAGIFVKGNIPIESADGHVYEIRNRVALCRCGKSMNKPFCDATHVEINFSDKP
jgi:CDGSH-type Zn-finger protein